MAVTRKLAERAAASTVPVEYIGVDVKALPLEDASVDRVAQRLDAVTIPPWTRALAEIRRVLRPAGAFHLHGAWPVTTGDGSPVTIPAHPTPAARLRRLPPQPADWGGWGGRRAGADPAG